MFFHSTLCPIRRFSIRHFVPFGVFPIQCFFHSTFCTIRPFVRFGGFFHSTFCSIRRFFHSMFCPIRRFVFRRFVIRRFVLSAFVTSTFCRWTFELIQCKYLHVIRISVHIYNCILYSMYILLFYQRINTTIDSKQRDGGNRTGGFLFRKKTVTYITRRLFIFRGKTLTIVKSFKNRKTLHNGYLCRMYNRWEKDYTVFSLGTPTWSFLKGGQKYCTIATVQYGLKKKKMIFLNIALATSKEKEIIPPTKATSKEKLAVTLVFVHLCTYVESSIRNRGGLVHISAVTQSTRVKMKLSFTYFSKIYFCFLRT